MQNLTFFARRPLTNRTQRKSLYRLLRSKLGYGHKTARYYVNTMLTAEMPVSVESDTVRIYVLPPARTPCTL